MGAKLPGKFGHFWLVFKVKMKHYKFFMFDKLAKKGEQGHVKCSWNLTVLGFLAYLEFSSKGIKAKRDAMRLSDTDLKSLNRILSTIETPQTIRIDPE